MNFKYIISLLLTVFATLSLAAPQSVRWTGEEDANAEPTHILEVIKAKTGIALSVTDFALLEDRMLANNHFTMLEQTASGVPIQGNSIRIWSSVKTGEAIQVEARVDLPPKQHALRLFAIQNKLNSQQTAALVREIVSHSDDKLVRTLDWKDYWVGEEYVRVVKVKGKHGVHTFALSHADKKLISRTYSEFPQADSTANEFSLPVQIYPIYQEVEGTGQMLRRVRSELRYLKGSYFNATADPYSSLRAQRYPDVKFDPILGLTVAGRSQGYWAMSYVKAQAAQLLSQVPLSENSFAAGGVVLEGRYTTINFYPNILQKFKGINFTPPLSAIFRPDYRPMPEAPDQEEMVPSASLRGRPITSIQDLWSRPDHRLPDNDPATYINDGFDEVQVYWAVSQLFDSLRKMGFTDPELSTRPFNAFLFDPDIAMRDNAFYTDDTINFTTYSPSQPNMARDNSTIWHELGHGVMDRLMGDQIQLADTGGLSEGMADFVAQLVLNDVTKGRDYPGKEKLRIFNHTGFYLTNEVHDDGEAYGGTMNDLLQASMNEFGNKVGLARVTDLTLETMRLTRNHPGLTANDWFDHMQFADKLGHPPTRAAGELHDLIIQALSGRNFNLDGSPSANFSLKNGDQEVVAGSDGSRSKPIKLKLQPKDAATFHLKVSLKSTSTYAFKYPVTVKVVLTGGPLQGAIHWSGKDQSPLTYTLNSESETLPVDVTASGTCDQVNREDGSCVDYAYVQIWNNGETTKPEAKKRFYLNISNK